MTLAQMTILPLHVPIAAEWIPMSPPDVPTCWQVSGFVLLMMPKGLVT